MDRIDNTTQIDGQTSLDGPRARKRQQNQHYRMDKIVRTGTNTRRISLADLARLAWPKKTDIHLAVMLNVDPRTCRRWFAEESKPPAEALIVILAEIMQRL